MSAVSFQNVTKTYASGGRTVNALRDVSFDIAEGEFFGLLGPNGAGKTTLISILAGLSRATGGRVSVLGHEVVSDYAQARRQLGVVPQELVFDPFFSVRETLRIQSAYFGLRRNDDWIDELLSHLGLSDKAEANMRQLSGGMKRRVLVAQALVHRPPVIVLDEPTAGVDVELRQTLWHFISQLNKQGSTVLLTTHYLEEAEALCNRIAMLKFFLKQQLIWVPVMGLAWWALEFPFMRRHSEAYLKKHPEMRGKDQETTRKACEKFALIPTSVMNFLEGTRMTPAKHAQQQSPYTHLLKPKAGGLALALQAMGDKFHSVLDVTIYYPDGTPTFGDFLCGRMRRVVVRARSIEIPPELLNGNYGEDAEFRAGFSAWVAQLWRTKDTELARLKADLQQ